MSLLGSGDYKRFIQGQITANGTSAVTWNPPILEANSHVILSINTITGTPGAMIQTVKTPSTFNTPGVLTWTGTAGNTSTYDVIVFV